MTMPKSLASYALAPLVIVCFLPAMLWSGFVWDDSIFIDAEPVREVGGRKSGFRQVPLKERPTTGL